MSKTDEKRKTSTASKEKVEKIVGEGSKKGHEGPRVMDGYALIFGL